MVYLVYVERNGNTYGYLAESFRVGNKVKQKKRYYGFLSGEKDATERIGMKEIIWFLKGSEGVKGLRPEELEKWHYNSRHWMLEPFCNFANFDEAKAMIHSLIKKLGFAPCALCYIVKYGIPEKFRPVFDEYNITEPLMKATNELARDYTTPGFVLLRPNEYFQGKPEEYDRMREFLREDPETQMRKKGDPSQNSGEGVVPTQHEYYAEGVKA